MFIRHTNHMTNTVLQLQQLQPYKKAKVVRK